jgi:hypothetical protein
MIANALLFALHDARIGVQNGAATSTNLPLQGNDKADGELAAQSGRAMSNHKPKVLGLGLSKTGTKSLSRALRFFGYSNHSWDEALFEQWFAGDSAAVLAVADAHDCVEDWPFLALYRELMDRYGASARYVLTLRRTPEIWLDSLIAHAERIDPRHAAHRQMAFGHADPARHRAEYLAYYANHNDGVRKAIAERGLSHRFAELCLETEDGWAGLCRLIGRPAPNAPFPHENRRPRRPDASRRPLRTA